MATILNEASNLAGNGFGERTRTVRLAENYHNGVYELLARVSDSQVVFSKLDDTEDSYDEDGNPIRHPSKNYSLNATEADAFVEAWTAYKADRAAALEAEEQRKAGVLAKAQELATELGLEITADENDMYEDNQRFTLRHTTHYINRSYAYSIDGLLEIVKEFQTALEDEHKAIEEARATANKITELCGDVVHITSKKPADGRYSLKIDGQFSHWNIEQVHASVILDRLQTILRDLERDAKAQTESAVS